MIRRESSRGHVVYVPNIIKRELSLKETRGTTAKREREQTSGPNCKRGKERNEGEIEGKEKITGWNWGGTPSYNVDAKAN